MSHVWYPLITAGMQRVGKVLANAFYVSLVQFVEEFTVPIAFPYIRAAITRAYDDDGLQFHSLDIRYNTDKECFV